MARLDGDMRCDRCGRMATPEEAFAWFSHVSKRDNRLIDICPGCFTAADADMRYDEPIQGHPEGPDESGPNE